MTIIQFNNFDIQRGITPPKPNIKYYQVCEIWAPTLSHNNEFQLPNLEYPFSWIRLILWHIKLKYQSSDISIPWLVNLLNISQFWQFKLIINIQINYSLNHEGHNCITELALSICSSFRHMSFLYPDRPPALRDIDQRSEHVFFISRETTGTGT